jgi:hypothetical protein
VARVCKIDNTGLGIIQGIAEANKRAQLKLHRDNIICLCEHI